MALIRSSGLFDEKWYLEHNSDIVRAKVDPVLHFLRNGGFERRDPGPHFSSGWYLDSYEDVKFAGLNPLVHYLKYGIYEGRKPNSDQLTEAIETRLILRRLHPVRALFIPYGSRREQALQGLKKALLFPLGIFNNAKRQKIRYILKNYGLSGLIAATIESARVTFVEGLLGRNLVSRVTHSRLALRVKDKTQAGRARCPGTTAGIFVVKCNPRVPRSGEAGDLVGAAVSQPGRDVAAVPTVAGETG
jgi:hypothetical protein